VARANAALGDLERGTVTGHRHHWYVV
jgi:hypothetical protein